MNFFLNKVLPALIIGFAVISGVYAVNVTWHHVVDRPAVASPSPTPSPSRFDFQCKASVVNPCKKHGRVVAYGATCEEARVLLENDLQTMACR